MINHHDSFITLNASPLSLETVLALTYGLYKIKLDHDPSYLERLGGGAEILEQKINQGKVIYGVTTGFGDSCQTQVPKEWIDDLPLNLVRFHGCGTGRLLTELESAAVLVVRLASLAKCWSGVRPVLLKRICQLLNHRVLPCIPAEGSVGASGDLTPLSYVAAVLMGEREVYYQGKIMPAMQALSATGIEPLKLQPKESLAMMNGTSVMTALGCIAYEQSCRLARWSAAMTAMTSDVLQGNPAHFDARIFEAKPHPGQARCAKWIRDDIEYHPDQPNHKGRIQDRYSTRCAPHVIGVLLDILPTVRQFLEIELNSSNDNPLIDPDTGDVLHGGNFYGGHTCMAMDMLKNAVANVADLLDRQFAVLCSPSTSNGLPANLIAVEGSRASVHHGFKAMQISASALTAEALKLTMPASVFSRSTECHNQDKVSMGTIAARDCLRILQLTQTVGAIVQLGLCQAVDLRKHENCHTRSCQLHAHIRQYIPINNADRRQDLDIQKILDLLDQNELPIGHVHLDNDLASHLQHTNMTPQTSRHRLTSQQDPTALSSADLGM